MITIQALFIVELGEFANLATGGNEMKMLMIAIGLLLLSMGCQAEPSLIHHAKNLSTPKLDCNPYIDQRSLADDIQCYIYDAESIISDPELAPYWPVSIATRDALKQLLVAVKAHKTSHQNALDYCALILKNNVDGLKEIHARLANSQPPIIYESPVYAQPAAPAQPPAQTPRSMTCNKIGNITTCDTY